MVEEFRNKTAIVGVGMSQIGRSLSYGAGAMAVDAVRAAVEDAGLKMSDIDGLTTYAGGYELGHQAERDGMDKASIDYMIGALGIDSLEWFSETKGGGPALAPLSAALYAVYAGQAKYAVVYRAFYRPKGRQFGIRNDQEAYGVDQFLLPYGYGNMLQFGSAMFNRFMYNTGVTKEHLGEYVLHCHRQAMLNEHAYIKNELLMDEYLNAPYYVDPLSKLDCDIPLDGAMAMVVTTADRAKDLRQKPVYVSGVKNALGPNASWSFFTSPEHTQFGSYYAGKDIWKRAGFTKNELGFVQLYDGFSVFPFIWAAHLELCKPSEVGDYIAEASRKGKEAEIPITTMGGALCEGRFHGMGHILESVWQLQGRAEQRQLKNVETGIAAVGGFNSCGVIALQS
jgi:acetyl-CoA acetyltransferase